MLLKKNRNRLNRISIIPFLSFFILAIVFSFSSCKDTKDTYSLYYGYEYYPVDSGHYVTYEVDSIFYSYNGQYTRDTARYQIKETVTDTFYDNENNLCYRLETFKRYSPNDPWEIYKVWKLQRTTTALIKTEDDLRYVKLIFPAKENDEWNGNIYLPTTGIYEVFKDWLYTYSGVHQPTTVGSFSFDSTLTVNQVDDETLIEKRLRKEVYAKGVGMIYMEWEALKKQNVQMNWQDGPENGFRIRMRIIDHN
jgi:hypothetical protein